MIVALPTFHPMARGGGNTMVRLKQLAGDPFILFGSADTGIYDETIAACREADFSPRVGQLAPRITSTLGLVAAGLGIALGVDAEPEDGRSGLSSFERRSTKGLSGSGIAPGRPIRCGPEVYRPRQAGSKAGPRVLTDDSERQSPVSRTSVRSPLDFCRRFGVRGQRPLSSAYRQSEVRGVIQGASAARPFFIVQVGCLLSQTTVSTGTACPRWHK